MRKIFATLICLLGLTLGAFAQTTGNQGNMAVQPQDTLAKFATLTAAGNTGVLNLIGTTSGYGGTNPGTQYVYSPKFATVQTTIVGSPSVCSYHVYGTLKTPAESPTYPADYQDLSGALDCTTAAGQLASIAYKPVSQIVIVLSTFTGGTSITFRYLAVH